MGGAAGVLATGERLTLGRQCRGERPHVRNRRRRFLVDQIRYHALSSRRPKVLAGLVELLARQTG